MGKEDLKNKLRKTEIDDTRASLFGSLEDFETANKAKEEKKESASSENMENSEKKNEESKEEAKTEKKPRKKPGPKPKINKNSDILENEPFAKKTYRVTHIQAEAIRIGAFTNGMDLSEYLRFLLDKSIPKQYIEQAKEWIETGRIVIK